MQLVFGTTRDPCARVVEWLRIKLGIVDQRLDVKVIRIRACPAFHHMQRVAMGIGVLIDPDLLILEADRVDDQRVAFPMAQFFTEEGRIGIFAVLPCGIDRDQPEVRVPNRGTRASYYLAEFRTRARWRCGVGYRRGYRGSPGQWFW